MTVVKKIARAQSHLDLVIERKTDQDPPGPLNQMIANATSLARNHRGPMTVNERDQAQNHLENVTDQDQSRPWLIGKGTSLVQNLRDHLNGNVSGPTPNLLGLATGNGINRYPSHRGLLIHHLPKTLIGSKKNLSCLLLCKSFLSFAFVGIILEG